MRIRLYITCICLMLSGIWVTPAYATARCFTETGYCIDGAIRTYWEAHGGLTVFGLPIAPQTQITIDGASVSTQLFERNRIELHPTNPAPYDVQLGLLGGDYLLRTTGARIAPAGAINEVDSAGVAKSARRDCQWFATTQQYVCGEFYAYWRKYGISSRAPSGPFSIAENTALFGLPITGVYQETINGQPYQVQLFERARFEYSPENPAPYQVQLGLLGAETMQQSQVQQSPVAPTSIAEPTITPIPTTPFVVADYLNTTGILPLKELFWFRNNMPPYGYWNSNDAADITVVIRDITYVERLKGRRAPTGMKYVIGTVTIINNRASGGASCRVHYADLAMIDLEGGWHYSDKITTQIDNSLSYKIVEPGLRIGGRVAFMMPYTSAPGQLVAQFTNEQPAIVELRVWPHTN
jgi:hypothetical protein